MYNKRDYEERIGRAVSPVQLVVINYDLLADYLKQGRKYLDGNDLEAFREQLEWARGCVASLRAALDINFEVSKNLNSLYVYLNGLLIKCSMFGKPEVLDEALRISGALSEAFKKIEGDELKNLEIPLDIYDHTSYNSLR